jgi:hypothetical protein
LSLAAVEHGVARLIETRQIIADRRIRSRARNEA